MITKNEDVQFYWILLSQYIDDVNHAEALLAEIVNLWVTISNGCIMDGRV